jgi:hypothetical protein
MRSKEKDTVKENWKEKYEREVANHNQTRTASRIKIDHLNRRIGVLVDAMQHFWTTHVHM